MSERNIFVHPQHQDLAYCSWRSQHQHPGGQRAVRGREPCLHPPQLEHQQRCCRVSGYWAWFDPFLNKKILVIYVHHIKLKCKRACFGICLIQRLHYVEISFYFSKALTHCISIFMYKIKKKIINFMTYYSEHAS